jgi:hypothetical protein
MKVKFNVFYCILCIIFSKISAASSFQEAKVIYNLNADKIKETSSNSRKEEWVKLAYLVGLDGKATDIHVTHSSSSELHIKSAKKYIGNLRFSPATFNGNAVESSKTFFMVYDKSFFGSNNDGISLGFSKRYEKINRLLAEKNFKDADEQLKKLVETNTRNLTEQAISAWLHAIYYYQTSQWHEYGHQVVVANILRDYLPTKMAITTTQNLLTWQMYIYEYKGALNTLDSLRNIKNTNISDETYQNMRAPIINAIKQNTDIAIRKEFKQSDTWLYPVTRSQLAIDVTEGSIKMAQLRCSNGVQRLSTASQFKISVPAHYAHCNLLIKSAFNSIVKVQESGAIH